ncbi:sugar ABC transporter substrate-binding protein [Streptomyces malaysiensis]|uniref:sugar ABC transporter substrate-binding protein n=1 Tax=Streptomyces malaysiensis TaxID=92644 RepID=UPI002B2B73BF|nr:sugar ABC transporter substrate-binding protein [Streptomyces malaysiensis]
MSRLNCRLAAVATAAGAAIALAGCGGTDGSAGDAVNKSASSSEADKVLDGLHAGPAKECTSGKGLTLGYAGVWSSNAGGKAGNDSFAAAAEACGATPLVVEAKADDPLNTMITAMDQIISQHADAVAFFPLTADVMTAPSQRAVKAGIPVVSGEITNFRGASTTFHQDRLTAAVNSARLFCEKYPDGGKVIYGAYGGSQQDLIAMQKRFKSELRDCGDGKLTIAGTYANKTDDIGGGRGTAQAVLQQHPDAIGVVAYSDTDAVAASRAASDLGMRGKLTIVGYNADAVGLAALQQGSIDYSFAWGIPEQQQKMVEVMIALAKGEPAPRFVTLYPRCVSRKTVDAVPSIAVRVRGIADGRDLAPTKIQPMIESDKPTLEASEAQRKAVACEVS